MSFIFYKFYFLSFFRSISNHVQCIYIYIRDWDVPLGIEQAKQVNTLKNCWNNNNWIKRERFTVLLLFLLRNNVHDARRTETVFCVWCFRWIPETSGHRYANNSIYPTAAWTAGLALNKFTLGKWLRHVATIDHFILEASRARTSCKMQVNREVAYNHPKYILGFIACTIFVPES